MTAHRRFAFALFAFANLLLVPPASAQSAVERPPADPADVASVDALMMALYDVISGPADEARDWDRLRSLFHPQGRMTPLRPTPISQSAFAADVLTVDAYTERFEEALAKAPMFQGKGFYESEAARRTERFGHLAHVWSTYEARTSPDGEPIMRGINTLQLMNDGERWWILNLAWEQETSATPLPEKYLSDGAQ